MAQCLESSLCRPITVGHGPLRERCSRRLALVFWSRNQVEHVEQEQVQEAVNRWVVPDNRTNGKYVPTEQPQRAPRAEPIDAEEMLADYQGKEQGAATDGFDPTPEAINAATQVKDLDLGNGNHVKIALLNQQTRGDRDRKSVV